MTTTLEAIDIVWDLLNASAIKTEITGGIYKRDQRPANTGKEDIVINSLPINNAQLQQGVINVNIHVPGISIRSNGIVNSMPDNERMKELSIMAVGILDDIYGRDYNFDVQQEVPVKDEITQEHYINIRLNFYSINISN